jgi:hypothetical protein
MMIYQPFWPAHSPLADAHDDDVLSSHQNIHLSSPSSLLFFDGYPGRETTKSACRHTLFGFCLRDYFYAYAVSLIQGYLSGKGELFQSALTSCCSTTFILFSYPFSLLVTMFISVCGK